MLVMVLKVDGVGHKSYASCQVWLCCTDSTSLDEMATVDSLRIMRKELELVFYANMLWLNFTCLIDVACNGSVDHTLFDTD
jgi:hypothetical protein